MTDQFHALSFFQSMFSPFVFMPIISDRMTAGRPEGRFGLRPGLSL
jgi:hypothetical protein